MSGRSRYPARCAACGRAAPAGSRLEGPPWRVYHDPPCGAPPAAAPPALDPAAAAGLYPYQAAGAAWLRGRRAALLADEMGLGKTAQALRAAPEGAPVLVVAPAVVRGAWAAEAALWRPDLAVAVLRGRGSFRWPAAGELVVTTWDLLPPRACGRATAGAEDAWRDPAGAHRHGPACHPLPGPAPAGLVAVLDEAHYAKAPGARRTQAARAVASAARAAGGAAWGLTGTPVLGRPPELWAVLRLVGLERAVWPGGWTEFQRDFGARRNRWGGVEYGAPLADLGPRLSRALLRRRRAEVLPDLPAKTRRDVPVELPPGDPARALCDAALAALAAEGIDLREAADLARATRADGAAFEALSAARAALAATKTAAALDVAAEMEEAEEPVVVFAAHRGPVTALAAREGWAAITGDTSPEERTRLVEEFQAGRLRGLACTIAAGGVGVTLTRAAHVVFVDLDWTPARNAQAEDRLVRIGQRRAVVVHRLVADHALDERVLELLDQKAALVEATVEAAADARRDDDGPVPAPAGPARSDGGSGEVGTGPAGGPPTSWPDAAPATAAAPPAPATRRPPPAILDPLPGHDPAWARRHREAAEDRAAEDAAIAARERRPPEASGAPGPAPSLAGVPPGTYTVVLGGEADYVTLRLVEATGPAATLAGATRVLEHLVGPDNGTDFVGRGWVTADVGWMPWRRTLADPALAARLDRAVAVLAGANGALPGLREAYAMRSGRCARCARRLTVPASLHRGLGPECAARSG